MKDMENVELKQRRSEKLSKEEFKDFKKAVRSFGTKTEAAEHFEFSIVTLDAILLKRSGHPTSIQKIRDKISQSHAA